MKARDGEAYLNPETGLYETCIPLPFYYGLFPWLWRRFWRKRDKYGRKAQLFLPWQ